MNKKSGIKLENFIVATTAASVCFFISFLRSWAIPVKSAIQAKKQSKTSGESFWTEWEIIYDESVMKLSQKPQSAYQKYYNAIDMLREKYKGNGK